MSDDKKDAKAEDAKARPGEITGGKVVDAPEGAEKAKPEVHPGVSN